MDFYIQLMLDFQGIRDVFRVRSLSHEYIKVYGVVEGKRTFRWFRKDYLAPVNTLDKYKVFISKADGAAGQLGAPIPARISGRPIVMGPGIASTETFISIGMENNMQSAEAIAKYVMTKFARAMLGTLKVTQNYAKPTWKQVPMQDFSSSSDIDWSQSLYDIDQQLYKKYALTDEEKNFIETYVKEMG